MKLKIVSYNIHKGFNWNNLKSSLIEIKKIVKSFNADIVFLQEVVGKNLKNFYKHKSEIESQFEFIADNTWPHYAYAKNSIYDHGHHGNVILSKYPILKWKKTDISINKLEKRGVLSCKIDIPQQGPLFLHCVHLNLLHKDRVKQYKMIQEDVLKGYKKSDRVIIAGDFNDWNQKASNIFEDELDFKEVIKETHGRYARTFPSFLPFLCLDRVYVKNFKIKSAKVLDSANYKFKSDHLGLYVELNY